MQQQRRRPAAGVPGVGGSNTVDHSALMNMSFQSDRVRSKGVLEVLGDDKFHGTRKKERDCNVEQIMEEGIVKEI